MRRQPQIQAAIFDVASWEPDAEFSVFPQGARAKDAVFAPEYPAEPVIVPGKRYMVKRSKRSYPDQFWAEIVAYRVGCLLGVNVTPTFAAWNSRTNQCAALIEWFYDDGHESFVMAGDFLQQMHKDFDRKLGTQHNLLDNMRLLKLLAQNGILESGWRQWWIDALLFDALIGNTDRHQDNWGLIFTRSKQKISCRLAPLFDNGTSLGHERFTNHVSRWTDIDFQRYISKGRHHVKWSLKDPIQGHFALLQRALEQWPDTREAAQARLNFSSDDLSDAVVDLLKLDAINPLSNERLVFMLHLMRYRFTLLRNLLL
ncbi:HipA domain-containing protein [Nitrosomonas sp. sh817]|uniref:HipA domain-containing protein n=1 Tax=Nitrosomonas sp. sh817 TaxID=3070658 RepID=UPI0027DC4213|nr:HipA domain-containing protein [Nitrosomonas sp. sh817]WMJ08578.1 HipA domain-containing protein [Nitrosomonas sp. sh817]